MKSSGSSLPDRDFSVNRCGSAPKEFKTKNPVITDREKRDKKNGEASCEPPKNFFQPQK